MTYRSLVTPNSGLRVFSASLLSALLIMMPFVQLARANARVSGAGSRESERGSSPTVREGASATTNAAAESSVLNAPIPNPAPVPAVGPVIVATKDDGLATATTVAPGGTINYSINIKNNGTTSPTDDATGVTFTDIIDAHTTLVVGSAVAAVSDRYNAIGNVQLSIPDGATDLLANDIDPDTGNNTGMTVTAETKSSTQCTGGCSNNVVIAADGSFTYDPPVGFSGTDTFTYTAHSTVGGGTATETVTITVANEIWFINNNAGACPGAPCDGRLSHPFVSLAAFTAANLGGAGQPGDNDWIFVYESATDYAGPATLRNGQKFIGQDATASLAALTTFPAPSGTDQLPVMNSGNGVFVNITGANVNGINLLSGNTLRGFRVGNVGTGTKISGTSFGTLLVGNSGSPDVLLHGTGRALSLTTGTLSNAGGFISVESTSSTTQGINLSGVADSDGAGVGSFSFGSTTITTTGQGILIGTTPADLSFGTTSVTGGTNAVSFQNNASGTRTFGALTTSGASLQSFLHGSGGGNVTVTGAATLSSAGSAISVSAPAATTAINFQAATSATTTGAGTTAVSWVGAANTSMTFNSLSITRNNGTALDASVAGTINVTNGTGSITNTTPGGPAIIAANIALNANFSQINSTGGNNGVLLTTVTGTSNFGTGQLTGTSGGATFQVAGGTATVTYSGNITQAAAALMVSISNHATGAITFQTGTLLASLGTGLQFSNADGTYNFNGTNTISGSNAHIQITNGSAGTFNFSSNTAVTNPSAAPAFDVSAGTASAPNVTYSGTLTQNTASQTAINISGINGGTQAFSGAITSNGGAGVSIEGTGGTVNISGNMTLNNTASVYKACSGTCASPSGTGLHISVTGSNNTVGATNAAATRGVQIDGAQIDAGGVTFKSIAVNGSTTDGILVKNTGSSGFFTVVGNGSAGTGGTIQNITNRGASFITTRNITLNWMNFTNANTADGATSDGIVGGNENTDENGAIHLSAATNVSLSNITISGTTAQHGINGNTVTNLDLTNITINTAGDEVWESGIFMFHLKGVPSASQDSVWDNVDINDTGQFNVSIINASGTNAAGGEKDKLTIQNGSSFKNSGKNVIGDHISNFNSVTANFQISVNTATFDSKINGEYAGAHTSDGIQVDVSGASARIDATITGCTFTSTTGGGVGQSAINISSTTGAGTFNVTNNTATVRQGAGINVAVTGTAALTGHITGNTLSTNITNNPSYGINMVTEGNGSMIVDVQNNSIQGSGSGIGTTTAFDYGIRGGARAGTGSAQFTIKGNTVQTAKGAGLWLFAGNNTGGETNTTCVNFSTGNTIDADFPTQAFTEYFLEQYTGTTFRIQGLSGSGTNSANVEAYVASTDLDPSPTDPNVSAGGGTVVNYSNAVCSIAPLLLAEGGIESALPSRCSGSAPFAMDAQIDQSNELSLAGFLGANSTPDVPTTVSTSITNDELNTIVKAAKERWLRSGLSTSQSNIVGNLMFEIGDLADGFLGEANGNRVLVDRDAQGKGWFIDTTPANDFEFGERTSATRSYTNPFTSAAGRIDLLTAIEHEIGHRLGLSDSYSENDRDSIMYGYLTVGERRVPATGQAANAQAGLRGKHFLKLKKAEGSKQKAASRRNHAATSRTLAAPVSGETVTANIGTLPAGGSVTITFQVTVNNPPNLTLLSPPRVENQGTVSGGNFASVLTDDLQLPGGAADKTATRIDLFDTTTSLVSDLNPSNDADLVTFTATINETPVQGSVDPTGTVDFIDTSNGNAVICNDVPVAAGTAQCQTSTLSAGSTHNIRADYSGDGNFDSSQSNLVAQVVNACVQNPVVINTADSGAGSLREALTTVCSAPNNNITFNIPAGDPGHVSSVYTITLLTELAVAKNVNITGPNSVTNTDPIVVSGNNATRVFKINSGKTVTMTGFTITGGSVAGSGAGVLNDHGTLTLINMTIIGNAGSSGGGVHVDGTTSGSASLTVSNSTISGNSSTASGGGIHVTGSGGGAATLVITNSTISGNNADVHGGGLYANFTTTSTLTNVTITNNRADNDNNGVGAGGGIGIVAGAITTLHNTIVAGNFNEDGVTDARDDVNGALDAASTNNLIGDGTGMTGITHGVNGNQVGTGVTPINALLGVLADNGGLTFTHALAPTSPAVETGSNTAATNAGLTTDQRGTGYPRIADSADAANTTDTVDIGAFELHPSVENIGDKTTAEDTAFNFDFNIGDDSASLITSVVATSSNQTLVPDANLVETDGTANDGVWNLSITPAADANTPADGTATITVTVTATNGQTAVDTFVVTVTEVNDVPVPTNDTVGDIGEDCSSGCTGPVYVIPFATLLGNDTNKGAANESGQTLNITAVSAPTGGSVVINGTNVEFTPTANFFGPAGFTYTVTDNGTTNTVSDPQTGNATVSFNVTAVNDPPSFTIAGNPAAVNEDAGAQTVNSFATSISAGPGETQTLTFNLTPTGTTGNISFASGPAIDETTGNLTYTTNADTNGTASFDVTLSDNGSNTPPNSNTSAAQSFTITVNAVDDAPTFQIASNPPAVNEDAGAQTVNSFATNFQPGPVTATDEGTQTLVGYTLTPTGTTGGLTFSSGPAIDNAGALTYTATNNTSGTATFDVVATDSGSNTPPNVNQSAPVSFTITVNADNDPPVNTVPGAQGTTVNTPLTFSSGNGNQISVADADAGTNAIKVTLSVTNGTLTLNGTTGLDFSGTCSGAAGDGTADITMTFCGTLTDINNALNGLTYNPTTNFNGGAVLTITSDDQGNSGGAAQTDTDMVNIQVSTNLSINDAQVPEPSSGTVDMTFTVALNAPAGGAVSVNFQTNDGTANAGTCGNPGADYVSTNGTVNFAVGEQVKTINVPVCSDNVADNGETLTVTLSSPSGATVVDGTATGTITANTAGTVLISELRTSGPAGAGDEFVEIYNNTNAPLTVAASDASAGYGLYKMGADCNATPVLIGVIPNGTVIPARGHYLFVGSAYSLGNYGGSGAAAGNLTLSADIETDANVGLFTTSNVTGISSVNRLDAVGFGVNTGGACNLLREGSTLPAIAGNATLEHSYFRKQCDWLQGQGCTVAGVPKDTNNNSDDFWLADTTGSATTGRLGAPGPENLASPIRRDNAGINVFLLDGTVGSAAGANRARNGADPAGTFGSMTLRYRVTNNTGGNVTRLRYRVVDISTAIQPAGPTADLRALTSSIEPGVGPVNDPVTCTAPSSSGAPPCTVTVTATTLEQPPNQSAGGGYNSTLSSGTITTGTPLGNGQSILINFKLGVEKTGSFRFYIIVEALP